MALPTIYLTNPSSRKLHGPGHLYHIMAFPPKWLVHRGCVGVLRPTYDLFNAYKRGRLHLEDYRASYEAGLSNLDLRPGMLSALPRFGRHWVMDGDTLVCTCSVGVARADACHRAWASRWLVAAGWRVILDGKEIRVGP